MTCRHAFSIVLVGLLRTLEQSVGQAEGLCGENVPLGEPEAIGRRFARGNTFNAQS